MTYTHTLTQDQLDDIINNYMNQNNELYIVQYVRKTYHAEYHPFRKELVFHHEKYYNWYILKHG